MRKLFLTALLATALFSCKNKKGIPDVSGIKAEVEIQRFDKAFFSIDTTRLEESLTRLQQEYPGFYRDFMEQLLGVSGAITDSKTLTITKNFFFDYRPIYDSVKSRFEEISWLRKELQQGYQFVKYYFPGYKNGKTIIFLGPFDAPGVAATADGLAIGLQQYAGRDFSIYKTVQMQEMFPEYISRRFSPEYMTANCMKAVVLDLFPDQSNGRPLIEQMIEKGKQWYLLDKFMPRAPDSVKTGFSALQLKWCRENEGLIWADIVRNDDLNSISPAVIQTYIGDAPFTQGFSQEYSPGNIGQWFGWQIVKKFVAKHASIKPEEVMKTPARKIMEEAKYKPK